MLNIDDADCSASSPASVASPSPATAHPSHGPAYDYAGSNAIRQMLNISGGSSLAAVYSSDASSGAWAVGVDGSGAAAAAAGAGPLRRGRGSGGGGGSFGLPNSLDGSSLEPDSPAQTSQLRAASATAPPDGAPLADVSPDQALLPSDKTSCMTLPAALAVVEGVSCCKEWEVQRVS